MDDSKFKMALKDEMDEEYSELLKADEEHEFSPKFEKKMEKLIKRQRRPYFRMINTAAKKAACIAVCVAAVSCAAVMSVEGLRNKFLGIFIDEHKEYSVMQAEDAVITEIEVQGKAAIYFLDNHDYSHIVWDNGDYIITLSSNLTKDEVIDIADSVQKAD